MTERFTFGIPLIARTAANHWQIVEALLELTLLSVRAQTDQDFRVIIAGHDRPRFASNLAFDFIEATWAPEAVRADNLDSGRKKTAISQKVAEDGGGLLMFLDADDWADRRLVETARRTIEPHHVGGIITSGCAVDIRGLKSVPVPGDLFEQDFHRLCGSSIVARLDPAATSPVRRNPLGPMHEHYRWIEACRENQVEWRNLDVLGSYTINTAANHSEQYGHFSNWRREFTSLVARDGQPLRRGFLAGFGLTLEHVERVGSLIDEVVLREYGACMRSDQ